MDGDNVGKMTKGGIPVKQERDVLEDKDVRRALGFAPGFRDRDAPLPGDTNGTGENRQQ